MAIDYSLLLTLKSMFRDGKYGREHNKHDFDVDYNNYDLKRAKSIDLGLVKNKTDDDDFDK